MRGNMELTGRGNPFLHHFVNDLGGGFMVSLCLRKKVIDRHFRQPHKAQLPLCKPAGSVRAKFGNGTGQFFIKSVVFIISQVFVFHQFLLRLNLSGYAVSATHCVKNPYRVIANGVIENFNRVTRPVETNKTVFIAVVFQQTVVNSSPKGMDNVFPRFPMLERRRHKYNFRLHKVNVTWKKDKNNLGKPDLAGFIKAARIGGSKRQMRGNWELTGIAGENIKD